MKIILFLSIFLVVFFFNACSGHLDSSSTIPSVYKTGGNTHSIILEAGEDFVDINLLEEKAYKKAEDYCASIQKKFQLVNEEISNPPYYPGKNPRIALIFRCY